MANDRARGELGDEAKIYQQLYCGVWFLIIIVSVYEKPAVWLSVQLSEKQRVKRPNVS